MKLTGNRDSIKADLTKARNTLPKDCVDTQWILQYQEFLDHNEFELACDMLEDFAETFSVKTEFWFALRDAAINMKLSDRAKRYEEFSIGRQN